MEKLKIIVNHEKLKTTSYDFETRLLNEYNKNLFLYNKDGTIKGLDYQNYAYAASKLMDKMNQEVKEKS